MSGFVKREESGISHHDSISLQLDQAKRNVYASNEIGEQTLVALAQQSETLDSVEQKIEDTDFLVSQSVRHLRGMTWSGTLYNTCADVTSFFSAPVSRKAILEKQHEESISQSRQEGNLSSSARLYESKVGLFGTARNSNPSSSSTAQVKDSTDRDLEEIAQALSRLKSIGLHLGDKLSQQNEQLDRIENSTDRLNENTLSATLRTSKVSQRTSQDPGKLFGVYQFIELQTTMLLAADGDRLVLTNDADTSTLFEIYLRYNIIVGLKNKRTGKFLGRTMWGSVCVSGLYFGSMEEWYCDFNNETTGLLCLSKNWGSGGWLQVPSRMPSPSDMINEVSVPIETTTLSIHDKQNCLQFRLLCCTPPSA